MTQDEQDHLADDATHAAEDAFAQRGLKLSEEQMFALNDYYLTLLVRSVVLEGGS